MAASRASHRLEALIDPPGASRRQAAALRKAEKHPDPSSGTSTLSPRTRPSQQVAGEPEPRYKILLVDDDRLVLESLHQVLENEGYEVWRAGDGIHAVREFITRSPDLILLDLKMPGMNGLEAFSLMDKIGKLVPCILITAYPNQYPRAAELHVDGFMEKPLDLPVLLGAIQNLLREPLAERIARVESKCFKTLNLTQEPSSPTSNLGGSGHDFGPSARSFRHRRWS